ncbi:CpaE family protein [Paenibacillus chartarius]|uniref:CpaE family protein n=1 Tax=Paenibacillus chartarius TaxID=747481 RepID=A0ABV6DMI9_9BACL
MLQLVLFRHNHSQRTKAWIERLKQSGYDVKSVHDPDRISGETDFIVIDTTVGRWKDYVRLLEGHGIPVVLLTESDEMFTEDELASLGATGTVSPEEETDQVFARFLRVKESDPSDQEASDDQTAFPQYGRTLMLSEVKEPKQEGLLHEKRIEPEASVAASDLKPFNPLDAGKVLSQRKAEAVRQRLTERSSVESVSENHEHRTMASLEPLFQDYMPAKTALPEVEEREPGNNPVKARSFTTDEETEGWPDDLAAQRMRQSPPLPSPRRRRDLPAVAAVYGAKGGAGKTTFLLHLAALLSKEERRVCVLDLDLMHGTVASMLHIRPNKTIVDLARRIDDPKASRACLLQTKMGFSIVASPLQPGTFRMEREQLIAILRFLKEETDIVLIDTPVHFDSLIKLALEHAEQLFLMTTEEPASMESLARMKPLFSSLRPTPELYTIWNRLSEPAPKEVWRDELPWPEMLELPEDPTVGKAVRSGEIIASSSCSPYRLRVKQLADRWLGVEPERPGGKRNLLRRLLRT